MAVIVVPNPSATLSCGLRRGYPMGWTDERVEQLKALWTEGLSASQIARVLGGVTRNAVIGKVHRLGLAGRAGPARSERPRSAVTRRSVAHVAAPPPEIIEEDPVV